MGSTYLCLLKLKRLRGQSFGVSLNPVVAVFLECGVRGEAGMVWQAKARKRTTGMSFAGGAAWTLRPPGMSALAAGQALAAPLDVEVLKKLRRRKRRSDEKHHDEQV